MHLGPVGYEQQYQITDAGGNKIWQGTAIIGKAYRIINTDTATLIPGQGAMSDGPNSSYGRADNLTTNDPMLVTVAAKGSTNAAALHLGVVLDPTAVGTLPTSSALAAAPRYGTVAGPGSLTEIICTSATIAVGDHIGFTATALSAGGGGAYTGAVGNAAGTIAPATYAATSGLVIGMCTKASIQMGSSGRYMGGIQVQPL